jgi:hypothetical protein
VSEKELQSLMQRARRSLRSFMTDGERLLDKNVLVPRLCPAGRKEASNSKRDRAADLGDGRWHHNIAEFVRVFRRCH